MNWLDVVQRDMRYAARTLLRAPRFTAVIVVTLALGIGVNATLFALADAVLFRPFPFSSQDRLVIAGEALTDTRAEVSYPDFLDWQRESRSFEGLAAMGLSNWTMTLREGDPQTVLFRAVSGNWFGVLGGESSLGRVITPADDGRGVPRVVVLSHAFWQQRFGGRPDIVGQRIRLDDNLFEVVGVMPRDFAYPAGADLWTALVPALAAIRGPGLPDFLESRGTGFLHLVGRLAPGVSIDAARGELTPLVVELARRHGRPEQVRPRVTWLVDDILGPARVGLLALLGAVALLLLVTLANTSGLLLIHASKRRGEMAIRAALGASRAMLVRQHFWESLQMAVLAGAAALLLARASLPLLRAHLPDIPRVGDAAVDSRVVLATALTVLGAAIGCWLPLLFGLRGAGVGRATDPRRPGWPGALLVTLEIATTVVLLSGAGLLYQSVERVTALDVGFDPSGLLAVATRPPEAIADDPEATRRFEARMIEAIRDLPQVTAAGAAGSRPLKGPIGLDSTWQFEGQSREAAEDNPWVNIETVTPGYLETMKTPLVAGRLLNERDTADSGYVVVVSEALTRSAWPGMTAIGRRLRAAALDPESGQRWYTVVGVVADVRYRTLSGVSLDVYAPAAQSPWSTPDIMVRASGDLAALAPLVRSRLRELDSRGVVTIDSMSETVRAHQAPWRSNLIFFGVFAVLTLVLATIGVYALLAASVAGCLREIGVRLALGATRGDIGVRVGGRIGAVAIVGMAIGVGVAAGAAGAIRTLLFETSPLNVTAPAVACGVVIAAALAAGVLPVRRATRVDPAIVLRGE